MGWRGRHLAVLRHQGVLVSGADEGAQGPPSCTPSFACGRKGMVLDRWFARSGEIWEGWAPASSVH